MYDTLKDFVTSEGITLVAVSKTKPNSAIQALYTKGQRIFGENRVQELSKKYEELPKDIEWHMIGQLQKNKVKYIAPFVSMIHSCDSLGLAQIINKQAIRSDRTINILLQIKIALEETKSGWSYDTLLKEIPELLSLTNINICGVMGMGTFTSDKEITIQEFSKMKTYFDDLKSAAFKNAPAFKEISMGMSGDYKLAVESGSTMVRIGSLLFGQR